MLFSARGLFQTRIISLVLIALLAWPLMPAPALAQDGGALLTAAATPAANDTSQVDPDGPQVDSRNQQANNSGPGATKDPDISWKRFPIRVLEDQKDLWL